MDLRRLEANPTHVCLDFQTAVCRALGCPPKHGFLVIVYDSLL